MLTGGILKTWKDLPRVKKKFHSLGQEKEGSAGS